MQEVQGGGKDIPWGRGGADETVSLVRAELSTVCHCGWELVEPGCHPTLGAPI